MIGVISKKHELEIIEEFFQLFKTPWEFYDETRFYDVVITTENEIYETNAKLLVIYGSEKKRFDSREDIAIEPQHRNIFLDYDNVAVPIYGNISTFNEVDSPFMWMKGDSKVIGFEIERSKRKILRVGYDLFQEVLFLLSSGQPTEYAHIPTLEIHISILRNLILDSGIPLVEIPPVPAGYEFITCLTHDVDFVGIRNHKFDHTMFGFIYRALFGSFIGVLKRKTSWDKLLKNWNAVLLLPAVYLGIVRDFWLQFDRYMEIEKGLRSTFFLIPFKNRAGNNTSGPVAKRRSARYDITDVKPEVERLLSCGSEIGLHGIDAWQDSEKAHEEFNRISHVIGESNIGVRMHWLYFCNDSPQILENAGFSYDSTFGYNDAVGYQRGTTQVFRPIGVRRILELPMHIQDAVLFSPRRMNLSQAQAWNLCKDLIENASLYGGVLTVLWHHRSLAPERLWGDFYINLLEELKARNVWFGTASQVVNWFRRRRALTFQKVHFTENVMRLKLESSKKANQPALTLRIYHQNAHNPSSPRKNHIDIPWKGETDVQVPLQRPEIRP